MSLEINLSRNDEKTRIERSRTLKPGEISLQIEDDGPVVVWRLSPLPGQKRPRGEIYFGGQRVYRGPVLGVRSIRKEKVKQSTAFEHFCLVHTHKCKYVLVAHNRVARFTAKAPITHLASTVKVDEPIPWAKDTKQNIYLFDENTLVSRMPIEHRNENPYAWFFARRRMPGPTFRVCGRKLQRVSLDWGPKPLPAKWNRVYAPSPTENRIWTLMSHAQLMAARRKWGKAHGFSPLSMQLLAGDPIESYVALSFEFDANTGRYVRDPMSSDLY